MMVFMDIAMEEDHSIVNTLSGVIMNHYNSSSKFLATIGLEIVSSINVLSRAMPANFSLFLKNCKKIGLKMIEYYKKN